MKGKFGAVGCINFRNVSFAEVEDEDLARSLDLINQSPRKCLGWETAHESFLAELSHLA